MSEAQIDRHAMVTFAERVRLQAQQAGTKLMRTVSLEELDGEKRYFDRYGAGQMIERTTRGQSNTPQELPRSRRAITPRDFEYTEEFDLTKDEVRLGSSLLRDSEFEQAVSLSFARKIDDVIIEAFHGDALSGKNGELTIPFDPDFEQATVPGVISLGVLRQPRVFLKAADVDDDAMFFLVNPIEFDLIFENVEPTSADYNVVKALVEGEIHRFMGFDFIQSTRVLSGSNGSVGRWLTFYSKPSTTFAIDRSSVTSGWEKIPGRGNTWQFSLHATMAATRQFETHIVRRDIT